MLVSCLFSAPLVFLAPNCGQWIMREKKRFRGTVSIPDRILICANKIKWSRHLFVPITDKLIAVQCTSGCILKLLIFYGFWPAICMQSAPYFPSSVLCFLIFLFYLSGWILDDESVALLEEFCKDPEPIVAQSCEVALSMLEFERSGKSFEVSNLKEDRMLRKW